VLGNFQAYCSYKLCHEVVIAISAHQLLKSVTINVFTPTYNPTDGYKVSILNFNQSVAPRIGLLGDNL
jgi:hypothetical protein